MDWAREQTRNSKANGIQKKKKQNTTLLNNTFYSFRMYYLLVYLDAWWGREESIIIIYKENCVKGEILPTFYFYVSFTHYKIRSLDLARQPSD